MTPNKHVIATALQKNFADREGYYGDIEGFGFGNNEVLANIEGVLEIIRSCLDHPPLTPLPSRDGK